MLKREHHNFLIYTNIPQEQVKSFPYQSLIHKIHVDPRLNRHYGNASSLFSASSLSSFRFVDSPRLDEFGQRDGGDVGVGANGAHVAVVGGHADVDAGARQIHGVVGYGAGRVLTIFGKARDGEHFSCSYCSRMSCRRT